MCSDDRQCPARKSVTQLRKGCKPVVVAFGYLGIFGWRVGQAVGVGTDRFKPLAAVEDCISGCVFSAKGGADPAVGFCQLRMFFPELIGAFVEDGEIRVQLVQHTEYTLIVCGIAFLIAVDVPRKQTDCGARCDRFVCLLHGGLVLLFGGGVGSGLLLPGGCGIARAEGETEEQEQERKETQSPLFLLCFHHGFSVSREGW